MNLSQFATHAAQNPSAVLVFGEDSANGIYVPVEVDSNQNLHVSIQNATIAVTTPKSAAGNFGEVSVGLSATQILAANSNRLKVVLSNEGVESVKIGFDNSVSGSKGITLTSGEKITIEDFTGAIWGISVGASAVPIDYIEW